MAIPIKKTDGKYNYADYLPWPDDERWELIEGIPYSMSPAPSRIHQEILSPATSSKDMKEKFFLYEKYGVKEYWMVEPLDNSNSHFGSDYDTVG